MTYLKFINPRKLSGKYRNIYALQNNLLDRIAKRIEEMLSVFKYQLFTLLRI